MPGKKKPIWVCGCGTTKIYGGASKVLIKGPGWIRKYQFIQCRECAEEYRFAPLIRWIGEDPQGKLFIYGSRHYG